MSLPNDPRLIVGTSVDALAYHVTNLAECSRRYGSQAKTKCIPGIVVEVIQERSSTAQGRMRTFIVADYFFGGSYIKRCKLSLRSVKFVESHAGHEALENLRRHSSEEETRASPPCTDHEQGNRALQAIPVSLPAGGEATPTGNVESPAAGESVDPDAAEEDGARRSLVRESSNVEELIQAHDTQWASDQEATLFPINGAVAQRQWSIRSSVGDVFGPGCDIGGHQWSPIDYFFMMFPMPHLQQIVRLTNEGLSNNNKAPTTAGEILKFLGIMILCTKFEFRTRSSLWSTTPVSKYIPAPSFGTTGMSRMRFDDIWRYICWSKQPAERPPDMTSEQFRWRLVDDFVDAFNDHRASTFQPSELICVDESISRWYGKGGHWINHGLPMYVAMERKPDNGCEIQNSACGKSGIMMRLKLVKTADENRAAAAESPQLEPERVPHSAAILRELVLPWIHTDRIVCADSYFASVPAAKLLSRHGMRFIGVVKTSTRKYPMRYLASVELNHRGDRKGLVSNGQQVGDPSMLAFVWMDRQRRYFIATASSLEAGTPYKRWRWRQVDTLPNADPTNVELLVPQPKAAEVYYSACGMIDRHNRARQDTLGLEGKLETHDWAVRVNMTIFAMTVVDTWLAYSQCTETRESQKDFYTILAEELVDNCFDSVNVRGTRRSTGPNGMSPTLFERTSGDPRAGCYAHLTPTKKRKRKDGLETPFALQGRCRVCKKNVTTYVCSLCRDENPSKEAWVCYTRKGKLCYPTHMTEYHGV